MKMKELFDRGEFAVSAEVGPPKGIHVRCRHESHFPACMP